MVLVAHICVANVGTSAGCPRSRAALFGADLGYFLPCEGTHLLSLQRSEISCGI